MKDVDSSSEKGFREQEAGSRENQSMTTKEPSPVQLEDESVRMGERPATTSGEEHAAAIGMMALTEFLTLETACSATDEDDICQRFTSFCERVCALQTAVYVAETDALARLVVSSSGADLPDEVCLDRKVTAPEVTGRLVAWAPQDKSKLVAPQRSASQEAPDDAAVVGKPDAKLWVVPLGIQGELVGLVCVYGGADRLQVTWVQKFLLAAASYLALALWAVNNPPEKMGPENESEEAVVGDVASPAPARVRSVQVARWWRPTVCERDFGLVGRSSEFLEMLDRAIRCAQADSTVLIMGETGTGKELVARLIHGTSGRKDAPWVPVNCPAIPRELAESELFGHERGAFTGASEARPGKFELAHGGTLFLDEVGDLPLAIQAKLLRVLQEGEVERVGGCGRVRKVDVRVIAATNRDLREAIELGHFRRDLFFRLHCLPLLVPPLRDRLGDIELLAWHFLTQAAQRYSKPVSGFTSDAMEALRQYRWPGNVRELQHLIDRAVLLSNHSFITYGDLADLGYLASARPPTLHAQLREEKRRRVELALKLHRGNCSRAARDFGMSRANFARLLRSLGVDPKRFRDYEANSAPDEL